MNIKDDFILKHINEGYLVGGAVRDFLLGKALLTEILLLLEQKNLLIKLMVLL